MLVIIMAGHRFFNPCQQGVVLIYHDQTDEHIVLSTGTAPREKHKK
jgi:hypothetical protein